MNKSEQDAISELPRDMSLTIACARTDITLFKYGSIQMCHMHFDVDYEIEADRHKEKGLEV